MPHLRARYIENSLRMAGRLWPVVGLIGPRQCGKTTVFSQTLPGVIPVSLDDLAARNEATHSPATFLGKMPHPCIIDEIQKAPQLFDQIKLNVDRKKMPGSYYITGSTALSSREGIRESLTGRIGLHQLLPFTLGEAMQKAFRVLPSNQAKMQIEKSRFSMDEVTRHLVSGGMPVPMFLRSSDEREYYWKSWFDARACPHFSLNVWPT